MIISYSYALQHHPEEVQECLLDFKKSNPNLTEAIEPNTLTWEYSWDLSSKLNSRSVFSKFTQDDLNEIINGQLCCLLTSGHGFYLSKKGCVSWKMLPFRVFCYYMKHASTPEEALKQYKKYLKFKNFL